MAARPDCWCPTFISGRARNGCGVSRSCPVTVPASGSRSATTIMVTHGGNSDTKATRLATHPPGREANRDTARHDPASRVGRLARASSWPARRRPPHRGGRLPGPAVVFDRLRTSCWSPRPDYRGDRRRRSLLLPERRATLRRPPGAAGADRRLLHVDGSERRPLAPRRRRLRRSALDVDAPLPGGDWQQHHGHPALLLALMG